MTSMGKFALAFMLPLFLAGCTHHGFETIAGARHVMLISRGAQFANFGDPLDQYVSGTYLEIDYIGSRIADYPELSYHPNKVEGVVEAYAYFIPVDGRCCSVPKMLSTSPRLEPLMFVLKAQVFNQISWDGHSAKQVTPMAVFFPEIGHFTVDNGERTELLKNGVTTNPSIVTLDIDDEQHPWVASIRRASSSELKGIAYGEPDAK